MVSRLSESTQVSSSFLLLSIAWGLFTSHQHGYLFTFSMSVQFHIITINNFPCCFKGHTDIFSSLVLLSMFGYYFEATRLHKKSLGQYNTYKFIRKKKKQSEKTNLPESSHILYCPFFVMTKISPISKSLHWLGVASGSKHKKRETKFPPPIVIHYSSPSRSEEAGTIKDNFIKYLSFQCESCLQNRLLRAPNLLNGRGQSTLMS